MHEYFFCLMHKRAVMQEDFLIFAVFKMATFFINRNITMTFVKRKEEKYQSGRIANILWKFFIDQVKILSSAESNF